MKSYKFILYILLILLFTTILIGCSGNKQSKEYNFNKAEDISAELKDTVIESEKEDKSIESKDNKVDKIQNKIDSMTLEEKIGQIIMIGIDGQVVNEQDKSLIQDNHIGGVILFSKNIDNAEQLLDLNNQIKTINKDANNIPIFTSVDEEGGIVSRMPPEIINLPNSKDIGDKNNIEIATKVGNAIGERTYDFGFNMTMAPVLDINSNPNNPVIGVRSFGNNKEIVSNMGIAEMKGIQSEDVIPVIKHFPGHGDTDVDSHIGLPVINHDINRLKELELVPFQNAINEGADVTMIAHILMPQLDQNNPSSLSKTIISDILREELQFKGVVITDDMTMGAILENYKIGEASVKSIQAGSDIILVCHGHENKIEVINSLHKAVRNGDITEDRIDESVYRILSLKEKYNIKDSITEKIDIGKINQSSKQINIELHN